MWILRRMVLQKASHDQIGKLVCVHYERRSQDVLLGDLGVEEIQYAVEHFRYCY